MEVDLERLGLDVGRRDVRVDARVDPHRARDDAAPARRARRRPRSASRRRARTRARRRGPTARRRAGRPRRGSRGRASRSGSPAPSSVWSASVASRARASAVSSVRVRVEEVRVGGHVRAADPAADLVELREPERVGALDDRVFACGMSMPDSMIVVETSTSASPARNACIRSSSSRSDIWPCATRNRRLRAELLEPLGRLVDRLDAVVEVEGLALRGRARARAPPLTSSSSCSPDGRPDRPAPLGRRLDDRDVAQAGQRHVERARDRRRREREHVDLEPQRAEELLLRDAEALLLVDDDEPELLRDDVAREDPVRPDEHLDLALARTPPAPLLPRRGLRKRETISTRMGKSR